MAGVGHASLTSRQNKTRYTDEPSPPPIALLLLLLLGCVIIICLLGGSLLHGFLLSLLSQSDFDRIDPTDNPRTQYVKRFDQELIVRSILFHNREPEQSFQHRDAGIINLAKARIGLFVQIMMILPAGTIGLCIVHLVDVELRPGGTAGEPNGVLLVRMIGTVLLKGQDVKLLVSKVLHLAFSGFLPDGTDLEYVSGINDEATSIP
mmetsp:Transcript_4100/g.9288  ORF Transcript_4100/g.9288 Transcript_4100/m.9288 type:complete len:206 (-) Transcript_4100:866-1483(-)